MMLDNVSNVNIFATGIPCERGEENVEGKN
jgi:hypothetical protein